MKYQTQDLTEGEKKIIKALERLEKLWEKEGQNLTLFNGNSLRKNGVSVNCEVAAFDNIKGEGGDGGDCF